MKKDNGMVVLLLIGVGIAAVMMFPSSGLAELLGNLWRWLSGVSEAAANAVNKPTPEIITASTVNHFTGTPDNGPPGISFNVASGAQIPASLFTDPTQAVALDNQAKPILQNGNSADTGDWSFLNDPTLPPVDLPKVPF